MCGVCTDSDPDPSTRIAIIQLRLLLYSHLRYRFVIVHGAQRVAFPS